MAMETDGRWWPQQTTSRQPTHCSEDPESVRKLLHIIRDHISQICGCDSIQISYEDIANICVQLDYNSDTLRNAALDSFTDKIRLELGMSDEDFGFLVWNAVEWIKWSCFYALGELSGKRDIEAINQFEECVLRPIGCAEIVSLNHDLHLDQVLGAESIAGFCDGAPSTFHPDYLKREGLRLIKLHGSIDWFSGVRGEPTKRFPELVGQRIVSGPLVLSGTISKLEDYNYGPFPWLWAEFQSALRETRRIVVCGYGFKDVGINSRVADWLTHYPEARLLILHPDPAGLINSTRNESLGAIRSFFDDGSLEVGAEENFVTEVQVTLAEVDFQNASARATAERILKFASGEKES